MDHLNALAQVELKTGNLTLRGFSRSGLATYLQVPELDCCFDLGECPLSALSLNHVFLTHAHGDHARCVPRHWQLRRMLGNSKPAAYLLPAAIAGGFADLIRAEARFEGTPEEQIEVPSLIPLHPGGEPIPLPYRKDLRVAAFEVPHGVPSLGYTVFLHKAKLKPEFHGLPGQEIARLRQEGVPVQSEVLSPLLTFIGDSDGRALELDAIWQSPVLVLEASFLAPDEEAHARERGHTHIAEIARALEERGATMKVEHLVLKHFSMNYEPETIRELVKAAIPAAFADRVRLLL